MSGSVAGSFETGFANYSGMAPAAKLAFFDIGLPDVAELAVPADLNAQLFPPAANAGAALRAWLAPKWAALRRPRLLCCDHTSSTVYASALRPGAKECL